MPATNKPSEKPPGGSPELGGRQKFSVTYLVKLWECPRWQVHRYISDGDLTAHVFLPIRGGDGRLVQHDLPLASARILFRDEHPLSPAHRIELVVTETGQRRRLTIGRNLNRSAVRVLLDDVRHFETAHPELNTSNMRGNSRSTDDTAEGVNGKTALRDMLSAGAKRARAEQRTRWAPVQEAVRAEFKRLLAEGYGRTKAAHAIVSDGASKARIQSIAHEHGVTPWRGAFYAYGAVRKIVGV